MGYGYSRGWQWGSELIFPYGPLSFLQPYSPFSPELSNAFLMGQLTLCGLWAVLLFLFARNSGLIRQGILAAALLAWYPRLFLDTGWYLPFVVGVLIVPQLFKPSSSRVANLGTALILAVLLGMLALVKFTCLLMWGIVFGHAVLQSLDRRDFWLAAMFAFGAPIILVVIWGLAGQHPGGLVDYVVSSLRLSAGYAEMSYRPEPSVDMKGFLVLSLIGGLLAVGLFSSRRRWTDAVTALALAAFTFVIWKSGFVRADAHVNFFFGSAFFLAILCLFQRPAIPRRISEAARWLLVAGVVVVCLPTTGLLSNASWSLQLVAMKLQALYKHDDSIADRLSEWKAQADVYPLPRTKSRLGRRTVDLIANEQTIALINELNYQPRPIFQGYAAYTPELARLNERRLLADDAPDFLLLKTDAVDGRLATANDPLSILAALRAYKPVDFEGDFLVMQRTLETVSPVGAPSRHNWRRTELGTTLAQAASPSPLLLFFDVRLTAAGRLRGLLLREPSLYIDLTLADGQIVSQRLVRRLGTVGLLLSPQFQSGMDMLDWYASISSHDVSAIRLRAENPDEEKWFEPEFSYALQSVNLPRGNVAGLSRELQGVFYPGFAPFPTAVETARRQVVIENDRSVLFLQIPARVGYTLGPGAWNVSGAFGLLSSELDCPGRDGIALIVERINAAGSVTRLFARLADPVHAVSDRGSIPFELGPFALNDGDTVNLRFAPGLSPTATLDCDWGYLDAVQFKRVGETVQP
ncbi:MAG: hypothetical protein WBP11_11200 [Dokdonella sp.]